MKTLTKVALVSAMAISANAMAMQAMDDDSLSATTGQDGVTIRLDSGVKFDYLAVHDQGGTALGGLGNETGAIVIGDPSGANPFELATGGLDVVIDADGNAGAPVLNVNLDFGATTTINVGAIKVATSNFDAAAATPDYSVANVADAIDIGTITLDNLKVNLQLGNQAQGALIKLDSAITGGLQLSSLAILSDANDGTGAAPLLSSYDSTGITLSDLSVVSNGSGNLALNLLIDPTADGLVINGLTGLDVRAKGVDLGNGASIGGLSISNLNVGNVIIKGH